MANRCFKVSALACSGTGDVCWPMLAFIDLPLNLYEDKKHIEFEWRCIPFFDCDRRVHDRNRVENHMEMHIAPRSWQRSMRWRPIWRWISLLSRGRGTRDGDLHEEYILIFDYGRESYVWRTTWRTCSYPRPWSKSMCLENHIENTFQSSIIVEEHILGDLHGEHKHVPHFVRGWGAYFSKKMHNSMKEILYCLI